MSLPAPEKHCGSLRHLGKKIVPSIFFSRRAEADLLEIASYTLRTWGTAQADRYISSLEQCCRLLAHNPSLGRSCDSIRTGLRRMESAHHVVFYRKRPDGIFIVRILHQSMMPEQHSTEE
jgi:toxin ParE1/3/4